MGYCINVLHHSRVFLSGNCRRWVSTLFWNVELIWLDCNSQSWTKTGHWFITTCDPVEGTWSYFRIFLHEGARVCSKIKQLCFMIVCTQAEWLGLQGDLCACIMPWALPLHNPCGISQLQPSVLGFRWAWKKQTTLLSFITTALFLPQFWRTKESWALAHLPCISFDTVSLYLYLLPPQGRKRWQLLGYLLNDMPAYLMWNQLTGILVFTLLDLELLLLRVGIRK